MVVVKKEGSFLSL